MKPVFITLLLTLTFCASALARQTYAFVERDSTIYLDIYPPTTEPNGYTYVHMFGGGFLFGSRQRPWDMDYCRKLAERGYTAVAIDYRLGLKGETNVGIHAVGALEKAVYMASADCAAAVAFLVKHAEELGINPDKIILSGSSAGAITALMTDYGRCNALSYVDELPKGWKPAGVVAYSGAIYSVLGGLKWAEPPAPTLLWHGTVDKLVTYKKIEFGKRGFYGASAIAAKMEKNGYRYAIYRYKGLGHEVSMGGPMTMDELDLFVKQYITDARALHRDITVLDDSIKPSAWTYITVKDLYKKKQSSPIANQ